MFYKDGGEENKTEEDK